MVLQIDRPDWCPQRVRDEVVNLVLAMSLEVDDSGRPYIPADEYPTIARVILAAEQRERDKMEALLKDPAAVRVNYLRGGIACQPLIDDAVAKEREACAQVAEIERRTDLAIKHGYKPTWLAVSHEIATAIRNRSQDQ